MHLPEKKKARKIDSVQKTVEEKEKHRTRHEPEHEPRLAVLDDLKTNWVDITRKMKLNTN